MTNIFIDNNYTTIQLLSYNNYSKLFVVALSLSNTKAICSLFFSIVIFFFTRTSPPLLLHFSTTNISFSFLSLYLMLSSSLLHDVTFCAFRLIFRQWVVGGIWGGGGVIKFSDFLFDMPIDRMMCLFRVYGQREREREQEKSLWIMLLSSSWIVVDVLVYVCRYR